MLSLSKSIFVILFDTIKPLIAPLSITISTALFPVASALKNFQTALYLLFKPLTVYPPSFFVMGEVTLLEFFPQLNINNKI